MDLEKATIEELQRELIAQKAKEDEAYQLFTRAAASRCEKYVEQFSEAAAMQKSIRAELRKRKGVRT